MNITIQDYHTAIHRNELRIVVAVKANAEARSNAPTHQTELN
jgi:hypothetical protein